MRILKFLIVFQNLFPERGLKRDALLRCLRAERLWRFSEPIPRKGTETDITITLSSGALREKVFQNLFPERGLKLSAGA